MPGYKSVCNLHADGRTLTVAEIKYAQSQCPFPVFHSPLDEVRLCGEADKSECEQT
jgi:hypothetical protein